MAVNIFRLHNSILYLPLIIDLIHSRFIPRLFNPSSAIIKKLQTGTLVVRLDSDCRSEEINGMTYFLSAMEKATLSSSLTFTVPPATLTGLIPNSGLNWDRCSRI